MTIRTGRCAAPHSAARFTRVAATRLAQSHPSPQVDRELPHFLWKWHRLIKIGQELTKDISSRHTSCSPHPFSPLYHALMEVRLRLPKISLRGAFALSRTPFQLRWLDIPRTLHQCQVLLETRVIDASDEKSMKEWELSVGDVARRENMIRDSKVRRGRATRDVASG